MRSENFSEVIRFASVFSVAFPLLAYLIKFRSASRPIHIIGILAIVSATSDTLALVFFSQNTSTVLLFNSYYVISFALLAFFYLSVMQERMGRTTVLIAIAIYLVAFALLTISYQPFTEYQTFVWTLTGMIVLVLSVYYFLHIFGMRTPMHNNALLWINSGILYYFSLNLFLFVMSSYVLTKLEPQISLLIWSFHNINNILKNVLIGFGITAYSRSAAEFEYPLK